jgi:anti-anti-sigma factor
LAALVFAWVVEVHVALIDLTGTVEGEPSGALVLTLSGALDAASEHLVSTWMSAFQAESNYVLDLSEVTFIDSFGLRALLSAQAVAEERGATFELRSPSRRALDLLSLTGLDLAFAIT